jgi:Meiotically up-regulated gene 113
LSEDESQFKLNLDIFGVVRAEPGWIYLMRHGDLFKIGKTTRPSKRVREARTWLPHIEIITMKPFWNVSAIERTLHEGLANYWHEGEWFYLPDADIQEFLIEGFKEFYEKDRDTNSVDFIYWYNSSGMEELQIERDYRELSLKAFQRQLRDEQSQ